MNTAFWDARYSKDEYAYGEEPNKYLVGQLSKLKVGKILFPADGEGRNSVYAATLRWDVYAFDQSSEGKRKADLLAYKRGVRIHYDVAEMPLVNYKKEEFDAIVLIFAHFAGNEKVSYLKQLGSYLKPGGTVIFEAYSKNHIRFNSVNPKAGGPSDPGMLYSIQDIKDAFPGFEVMELKEEEVEIWEGEGHRGMGAVIRFTGRKSE